MSGGSSKRARHCLVLKMWYQIQPIDSVIDAENSLKLTEVNGTIAWWRHFSTITRILQFVFFFKLALLVFKPQQEWQTQIRKQKMKWIFGCCCQVSSSWKWSIERCQNWASTNLYHMTLIQVSFPLQIKREQSLSTDFGRWCIWHLLQHDRGPYWKWRMRSWGMDAGYEDQWNKGIPIPRYSISSFKSRNWRN